MCKYFCNSSNKLRRLLDWFGLSSIDEEEEYQDEEADEERDELEEKMKKIHDLEKLSFDGNHVFEDGDD